MSYSQKYFYEDRGMAPFYCGKTLKKKILVEGKKKGYKLYCLGQYHLQHPNKKVFFSFLGDFDGILPKIWYLSTISTKILP